MNAMVTDGPDRSAIAAAVRTNRPAPMIAPIPSATSANGPRVRLSALSLESAASWSKPSIDLVANRSVRGTPLYLKNMAAGADRRQGNARVAEYDGRPHG